MKTYTFAPPNAPVQEHMAGLIKTLVRLAMQADRDCANAGTARDRKFHFGRSAALRQIISVIEDSNSI